MIGVIDYRAGNSPSVLNAMNHLGRNAKLVQSKEELAQCSGIILPGVGSADATMQSLREMDCIDTLYRRVIHDRVPFLGICVGLQVIFESSEEGDTQCLGWLPGKVIRFRAPSVRIPQMGWNKVTFQRTSRLLNGVQEGYFYFVNSYHAVPSDPAVILGTTEYGGAFCSVVELDNIYAAQCHLEKSGTSGLKLLDNFSDICENARGGAIPC